MNPAAVQPTSGLDGVNEFPFLKACSIPHCQLIESERRGAAPCIRNHLTDFRVVYREAIFLESEPRKRREASQLLNKRKLLLALHGLQERRFYQECADVLVASDHLVQCLDGFASQRSKA